MTKLVWILSFIISFVFCIQSFIINDLDSFSNVDQEHMSDGEKVAQNIEELYPSKLSSKMKTLIGQVGGVDILNNGNLLVFHRGNRHWKMDTFVGGRGKFFNTKAYPEFISEKTLTLIDWKSLNEVDSWGSDMFHMPHGLTIDFENKIWVTDVGLHQVMKFDLKNMNQPELVLGEKLIPGNDESHFCKPTDVAVSKMDGHVFISDGYCNQRVVEFDKNGKFVKSFEDTQNPMLVVHSITLIESNERKLVCAASRETGKIVCFDSYSGNKVNEISHPKMLTVYAIKYDPINIVLHAATGENKKNVSTGFTFDASINGFGNFLNKWNTGNKDLTLVHDLATTPDGSKLFLGQLNAEIDILSYN